MQIRPYKGWGCLRTGEITNILCFLLSLSLSAGSVSLPLRGRWQTERRESLDCLTDEESPQGICNTLFPVGEFLRKVTYPFYQSHNRMFAKSCSPHPSLVEAPLHFSSIHLPRWGRLMRYTAPNILHAVGTSLPTVGANSIFARRSVGNFLFQKSSSHWCGRAMLAPTRYGGVCE